MDVQRLLTKHPVLYHMAEPGAWPSISKHGLLSTEALLDHLGAEPSERFSILSSLRRESISYRGFIIRDQKPMKQNLEKVLLDGITPQQWLEFLNRKVFFWTCPERLLRFRKAYKMKRQLIIEVPTERLVEAYATKITLCRMNSGAARMPDHFRNFDIFRPIAAYPAKRPPVEFTVEYAVKDIALLAGNVYETGGDQLDVPLHSSGAESATS